MRGARYLEGCSGLRAWARSRAERARLVETGAAGEPPGRKIVRDKMSEKPSLFFSGDSAPPALNAPRPAGVRSASRWRGLAMFLALFLALMGGVERAQADREPSLRYLVMEPEILIVPLVLFHYNQAKEMEKKS